MSPLGTLPFFERRESFTQEDINKNERPINAPVSVQQQLKLIHKSKQSVENWTQLHKKLSYTVAMTFNQSFQLLMLILWSENHSSICILMAVKWESSGRNSDSLAFWYQLLPS